MKCQAHTAACAPLSSTVKHLMQSVLDIINARCGWDCLIHSYDGYSLALFSGTCAEYATPLAEFRGVTYLACPTEFSHPRFRLALAEERAAVGKVVPIQSDDLVVVIEAETMQSLGPQQFTLVAESARILGDA